MIDIKKYLKNGQLTDAERFSRLQTYMKNKSEAYADGYKHNYLVKLVGACNRVGIAEQATAENLKYHYLNAQGTEPVAAADFDKIVRDVYRNYASQHNTRPLDEPGEQSDTRKELIENNATKSPILKPEKSKKEIKKMSPIEELIKKAKLSIFSDIKPPDVCFGFQDISNPIEVKKYIVGTAGNFIAISGKAKSRKSFLVTYVIGSILSDSYSFVYSSLKKTDKILIADTEQGTYHCQNVYTRIHKLSGISKTEIEDRVQYLQLRNYDTKVREEVIRHVIETEKPKIVVIDGIRDLAFDINSPQEATELSTKLLSWSGEHNIHIICVLHQNKKDSNLRGHLGSEILNKAEAVINVTKDAKNKDVSIVEPEEMREKEFEPFAFSIDQNGLPIKVDDYVSSQNKKTKEVDPAEIREDLHIKILKEIFETQKDLSQNKLKPFVKMKLKESGINASDKTAVDFITFYEMEKYIINTNGDKGNGLSKALNFNHGR